MGSDVVIVDEMAHVPKALFYKVIGPMLQKDRSVLFALSSPEGNANFFSELINLKVGGKPFFNVCDCQLVCEECRKLEDKVEQLKCNHVKQSAFWLNQRKTNRLVEMSKHDAAASLQEYKVIATQMFVVRPHSGRTTPMGPN